MEPRRVKSWDGFLWWVEEPYHIEATSRSEIGVLNTLYSIARRHHVFVDAGAGVGYYTVRLSQRVREVHAFEPNPGVRRVLERNIELNLCDNVTVWPYALGSKPDKMALYIDKLSSSLLRREGAIENVVVEVMPLDGCVKGADIIKIDVEGYELEVLEGSTRILDLNRPYILIEHHDFRPDWRKKCKGLFNRIREFMAKFYYIPLMITDVHYLWVPREKFKPWYADELKYVLWRCWVNKCIKNLQEGRAWYHGLPKRWWWGMCLVDFIEELPEHIEREAEWVETVVEKAE